MLICGDTHGKFKEFKKIAVTNSDKLIVQIGDFGLGFHGESTVPTFPPNALFFRGNHDNPAVCKIHPNYMGDYGSKIIEDRKVFWMGGAWSIDYKYRREGLSWWRDEELSLPELDTVMEQYLDFKPEIMITHDVCSVFAKKLLSIYSIDGSANLHPTVKHYQQCSINSNPNIGSVATIIYL